MEESIQESGIALVELHKGLTLERCGDVCGAIVKFQETFTKYPFPSFISSAFLGLAEAYRNGNNVMRLCILRVTRQSRSHLDKITNFEEFLKKIFSVIHTNDPLARAITLRMLGSLSKIISERKNVHHCICKGLDSHDEVEQEAAIFATIQFASDSHDFANSICNKIATLLKGLSTQLEIKLQLIPVLQHMHADVEISTKARDILMDLLPSYPTQDFVLITLKTLTLLSSHTFVDIPAQVELLLRYVRCDPRNAVRFNAIDNLNLLANRAAHLWSNKDINAVCETFHESTNCLKRALLNVMCTLCSSSSIVPVDVSPGSPLLNLCSNSMYDSDIMQSALAIKLQTSLLSHAFRCNKKQYQSIRNQTIDGIDSILLLLIPLPSNSNNERKALKIILSALQLLCDESGIAEERIYEIFFTYVYAESRVEICSDMSRYMLETLAAIATNSHFPKYLFEYKKKLCSMFLEVCSEKYADHPNRSCITIFIFVILCICDLGSEKSSIFTNSIIDSIQQSSLNHWTKYQIARQAFRLGQHGVARRLLKELCDCVTSEQHHFWISGLEQLAMGESTIASCFRSGGAPVSWPLMDSNITKAVGHYHSGISILMAAVTPNRGLEFQCEYARLRRETLQLHSHLASCCQIITVKPPPALSKGVLEITLNEKLGECIKKFHTIDVAYSKLRMSSFDCDPTTLTNIEVLQQGCSIMAFAIESLIQSSGDKSFFTDAKTSIFFDTGYPQRSDVFSKAIKGAFEKISSLIEEFLTKEPNKFTQVCTQCLTQCSAVILSVPISYPRYFFQNLQSTRIGLAIKPSNKTAAIQRGTTTDPYRIDAEKRLTLKVEGVIQRDVATSNDNQIQIDSHKSSNFLAPSSNKDVSAKRRFREVCEVKLHLTVVRKYKGNHKKMQAKCVPTELESHERCVEPQNDYFQSQFLLNFREVGFYSVVVETSTKDHEGVWWKTGPTETIYVKANDEAARIQQQIQAQQNSRNMPPQPQYHRANRLL